jgi:hypothetical protein
MKHFKMILVVNKAKVIFRFKQKKVEPVKIQPFSKIIGRNYFFVDSITPLK